VGGVGCRRTEARWRGGERRAVLAGVGNEAGETDSGDRDGAGCGEARRKTTQDEGEWRWKKFVQLRSLEQIKK